MIPALFATALALQQAPPPGILAPPPPPPVASSEGLRDLIGLARHCFDERWEVASKRRFAAERLVFPKTARIGSAAWRSARDAVLALLEARRTLKQCPAMLTSSYVADDQDRAARDYWRTFMTMNIDGQDLYATGLIAGLIDR